VQVVHWQESPHTTVGAVTPSPQLAVHAPTPQVICTSLQLEPALHASEQDPVEQTTDIDVHALLASHTTPQS
jgi:hypothetical protein